MDWSPSLLVGNTKIDDQHKQLFALLYSLEGAAGSNDTAQAYAAAATLQKYVEEHLREEEALLRSIQYLDYAHHCTLHQEFERKLASLVSRLATEEPQNILRDMKSFVATWLFNHISFVDQLYTPYLPEQP